MPARSLLPTRLYLASRSPRRRDLLLQIGISFDPLIFRQAPREDHELDETPQTGEDAASYVERLARNKAEHGWRIVKGRNLRLQPVLAAWRGILNCAESLPRLPIDHKRLPVSS